MFIDAMDNAFTKILLKLAQRIAKDGKRIIPAVATGLTEDLSSMTNLKRHRFGTVPY